MPSALYSGKSLTKLSVRTQRVAIPLGRAVLDADAVDHAVAGEPVFGRLARVRAVAQVPAVELGGDGAVDGQVVLGEFVGNGCVVAAQEEVGFADGQG